MTDTLVPPAADSRLAELARLFPEAFADGRLDPDALIAAIGEASCVRRYGLSWSGKHEAAAAALAPACGQWRHDPGRSLGDPDAPHRLMEGDNLEALKALRGELAGRIRVIYLDPPYNTGQGMLYEDNFRTGTRDYLRASGQARRDSAELRGARHAAWLSMMLPRLMLARELLREDGVLFVSIDDRETHHLRMLLDEVFGTENFVSTVVWRKKVVRGRGARHVLPQTEYLHVYARKLAALPPFSEPLTEAMRDEYVHADEAGPYKLIPLAKSGTAHSPRPNLVYPIEAPDGTPIACPTHQWRWSRETLAARMDEIVFKRTRQGEWRIYTKQRLVIEGQERARTPSSYYDRVTTTDGTAELKRLLGAVSIDFPKPSRLIRDLIAWATPKGGDDWVLDFFAGSCPTAQAVLSLNAEDGGTRRFICVQRPEAIAHPRFATIAALGLARIRRVLEELELAPGADPGLGVQVFTQG